MELVNQWLGVAKQLGDLEEERARLSQPSSSGAAEVNNARIGWVRVANALLANAELVGLDDDTDRPTFWGAFFTRRFANWESSALESERICLTGGSPRITRSMG
jgi:hypothetical protein